MSTKFFNNANNTLFDKLKGIASEMADFNQFLAVSGFFRSSGYFKLRKELGDVEKIRILVGINIDDIFRKHNKNNLFHGDAVKGKKIFEEEYVNDVLTSHYAPEIEEGILQMREDLNSGRLEMRIHHSKNLHAKFYLCLPKTHSPHSDGWVIMGSSNISESGLGITQTPRYELNVALKDYDDVAYCKEEFERLWNEGEAITINDIDSCKRKTYLGYQPTPYEIYIKVLIDTFGDQVEDDFTLQLPVGVKDLKYQKDAVIQGYQMLLEHNGMFLADVVGLGKTMIATMIAKRFIEANGKRTNVLVVFPPALEKNWRDTFELFQISRNAQFVSNGSLKKVIEEKANYKAKEEFDLIIVDEAHGFRSDASDKYDDLQKICKSACCNLGLLQSTQKKVMLLSATPLNNKPDDLLNQLLLFQNSQSCTIDGIPSLTDFFVPYIAQYKKLMNMRGNRDITTDIENIYKIIRTRVIDKITIRRTRSNIEKDPFYKADLKAQGIEFPKILAPIELGYEMDKSLEVKFCRALSAISGEKFFNELECEVKEVGFLSYARYRAIEFLLPEYSTKYNSGSQISKSLATIYKTHMVKRLESSFHAFKCSLSNLLRNTDHMIKMFEEDKVIIAPDVNVKSLQAQGMELDEIIEYITNKKKLSKDTVVFPASAFKPEFLELLLHDREILESLVQEWDEVTEDPKFDKLLEQFDADLFSPKNNVSGKLVLFSESVDTLKYLEKEIKQRTGRNDVLLVTADNRQPLAEVISKNFDANNKTDANKYNIIIASDVLAEGVNLHRSNVIVNYDSPWNATRLMQRIGRVNRIGSVAKFIYNYVFYPSSRGNKEINLFQNVLTKLQSFHSAYGEDAQIYSSKEIVKQFELYNANVTDIIDHKLALLREVRELYSSNRPLYNKIKTLPMKSRVVRDNPSRSGKSVVFISSNVKTEFYLANNTNIEIIDFLDAIDYLRAKPEEEALAFSKFPQHYEQVRYALQKYSEDYVEALDRDSLKENKIDRTSQTARKFLKTICRNLNNDQLLLENCRLLDEYIEEGIYKNLSRILKKMSVEYKDIQKLICEQYKVQAKISKLVDDYKTNSKQQRHDILDISTPHIVISETFV